MQFTFEIDTVGGLAAPGFVDALAGVVYADARLVDAMIAANHDGSLTLSFEVEADDAAAASAIALESFSASIGTAAARYDTESALAAAQLRSCRPRRSLPDRWRACISIGPMASAQSPPSRFDQSSGAAGRGQRPAGGRRLVRRRLDVAYRIGDGPDAEDVTSATFERALRYP